MNKQEAIERIEKLDEHYGISEGVYLEKRDVMEQHRKTRYFNAEMKGASSVVFRQDG